MSGERKVRRSGRWPRACPAFVGWALGGTSRTSLVGMSPCLLATIRCPIFNHPCKSQLQSSEKGHVATGMYSDAGGRHVAQDCRGSQVSDHQNNNPLAGYFGTLDGEFLRLIGSVFSIYALRPISRQRVRLPASHSRTPSPSSSSNAAQISSSPISPSTS